MDSEQTFWSAGFFGEARVVRTMDGGARGSWFRPYLNDQKFQATNMKPVLDQALTAHY